MVETSGSNAEHDGAKLDAFLEDAMGCGCMNHPLPSLLLPYMARLGLRPIGMPLMIKHQTSAEEYAGLTCAITCLSRSGIVADGTVAQDSAQAGAIWQLRESISEGLRHRGARPPLSTFPSHASSCALRVLGVWPAHSGLTQQAVQALWRATTLQKLQHADLLRASLFRARPATAGVVESSVSDAVGQLETACLRCAGPVYKYDLSVPIGEMYKLVEETRKRVAGHQDVQARLSSHATCDGMQSWPRGFARHNLRPQTGLLRSCRLPLAKGMLHACNIMLYCDDA